MNRTPKWQTVLLSVLCGVLALVLAVSVFATVYVHHLLGFVGRVDPSGDATLSPEQVATATGDWDPNFTGPTINGGDVTISTLPEDSKPVSGSEQIVNILLVGQDRRENEDRQRSDSMILCTVNRRSGTITLTSFLRDTYVYIPGYGKNKLNAAYQFGGFTLLNETMAVNFGLHIDGNVEVDFGAFRNVIDMLGGVRIELTAGEAQYINTKLGYNAVSSGVQTLNGEQALWYARNRSTSTLTGINNDFGRTERQRRLIGALIDAYRDQSIEQMIGKLDDILPLLTTNLSNGEILRYAGTLLPMLSGATIQTLQIPTDDTYEDVKSIGGVGDVLVPDLVTIRDILKKKLG